MNNEQTRAETCPKTDVLDSKYIIFKATGHGFMLPVLFSPLMQHTEIAGNATVVSAGFYNAEHQYAYGHSDSLGINSRIEDGDIIRRMLRMEALV